MSGITESRQRLLIAMLAIAALAILLTSLYERFANPSLLVQHFSQQSAPAPVDTAQGMTDIGRLMEAVAKKPDDRQALMQLVEGLMAHGQWPAAENFAQRLLELDAPDQENPRALFLMSIIQHNQGRHAQAAELIEKGLNRKNDPAARFNLAILYLHFLNKPAEGMAQLQQALAQPNLQPGLAQAIEDELHNAKTKYPNAVQDPAPAPLNNETQAPAAPAVSESVNPETQSNSGETQNNLQPMSNQE